MRVGLLIDRWEPERGGAEAALDAFARHLDRRGHEVHVFATLKTADPPGAFHTVRAGGWTRGARERRLGRSLTAAASGMRCDVTVGVRHIERVDALWAHGGAHEATLEGRWRAAHGGAAPRGRVPVRGRHRAFVELERAALEGGARAVLCPAPLVRDEFAALYPNARAKLLVHENGVDLDRFRPQEREAARSRLRAELEIEGQAPLVSFVGRNPVLKGLPFLLDAMGALEGEWHLLVAGPKRAQRWSRRARRAGLDSGRVHFRDHVDSLTLAAGSDLCVLPTWRDPCPLATLEALATGTPVVTSRFAGTAPAASVDGAIVHDPSDVAELKRAIARVLERIAHNGGSPERVRECVSARSSSAWLGGLEDTLLGLCAGRI